MPIYDFICRSCGNEFEVLVMGSSKPRCPKCESEDLVKQMSVFAHRRGDGSFTPSSGGGCSGCSGSDCSSCHQ